jgi:hypothetical protein
MQRGLDFSSIMLVCLVQLVRSDPCSCERVRPCDRFALRGCGEFLLDFFVSLVSNELGSAIATTVPQLGDKTSIVECFFEGCKCSSFANQDSRWLVGGTVYLDCSTVSITSSCALSCAGYSGYFVTTLNSQADVNETSAGLCSALPPAPALPPEVYVGTVCISTSSCSICGVNCTNCSTAWDSSGIQFNYGGGADLSSRISFCQFVRGVGRTVCVSYEGPKVIEFASCWFLENVNAEAVVFFELDGGWGSGVGDNGTMKFTSCCFFGNGLSIFRIGNSGAMALTNCAFDVASDTLTTQISTEGNSWGVSFQAVEFTRPTCVCDLGVFVSFCPTPPVAFSAQLSSDKFDDSISIENISAAQTETFPARETFIEGSAETETSSQVQSPLTDDSGSTLTAISVFATETGSTETEALGIDSQSVSHAIELNPAASEPELPRKRGYWSRSIYGRCHARSLALCLHPAWLSRISRPIDF